MTRWNHCLPETLPSTAWCDLLTDIGTLNAHHGFFLVYCWWVLRDACGPEGEGCLGCGRLGVLYQQPVSLPSTPQFVPHLACSLASLHCHPASFCSQPAHHSNLSLIKFIKICQRHHRAWHRSHQQHLDGKDKGISLLQMAKMLSSGKPHLSIIVKHLTLTINVATASLSLPPSYTHISSGNGLEKVHFVLREADACNVALCHGISTSHPEPVSLFYCILR